MPELQKFGTIVPVLESIVDSETADWERVLPELQRGALAAMSRLGSIIESTLEHTVQRSDGEPWDAELYGQEIPDVYAMVVFTAQGIPNAESEEQMRKAQEDS